MAKFDFCIDFGGVPDGLDYPHLVHFHVQGREQQLWDTETLCLHHQHLLVDLHRDALLFHIPSVDVLEVGEHKEFLELIPLRDMSLLLEV